MWLEICEIVLITLGGLVCLILASTGESAMLKGGFVPFWANGIIGFLFLVLAAYKVRNLGDHSERNDNSAELDEELAKDLDRHERIYFEEHGEYPAETTARLLKEKQAKKERRLKKD